jgi:hypothetical protein
MVLCLANDFLPLRGLGVELGGIESLLDGLAESIPQFGNLLSFPRSTHDCEQLGKLGGIVTNGLAALCEVIKLLTLFVTKINRETVVEQSLEEAR